MIDLWQDADESDRLRQGDVVRRSGATAAPEWGLILTADCDIAQNKARQQVSWLRIVPASLYLKEHFAPDQLRRVVDKQASPLAEQLSARLRADAPELTALAPASLCTWLRGSGADSVHAAAFGEKRDERCLARLRALELALDDRAGDALDRLDRAWTLLGRDRAARRGAVVDAFDGERGFPDFFLLPELPGAEGYGWVVLLRDIASVPEQEVFLSERAARIADRPQAFHRTGRLHDGVRFAVTQKLAFLFSRIGMPRSFEDACRSAIDLLADEIATTEPG